MIFKRFRVENYRNVIDSGWIDVDRLTAFVGQNEAGKSNLFEALYRLNPFLEDAEYDIDEDWPVDQWEHKDEEKQVCLADFELTPEEIADLFSEARPEPSEEQAHTEEHGEPVATADQLPKKLTLRAISYYKSSTDYWPRDLEDGTLDHSAVQEWGRNNAPNFVYIHDYDMSGAQVELDQLQKRLSSQPWESLSREDQTIKVVLDLARIDLGDFIRKGTSGEGRTVRSFDKRAASAHLTRQFQNLWEQKEVRFDIDVDGTTLNIFVEDATMGMPVRLARRSTGFRWYVSFAWRFTHASRGEYKNCILLLEEPGIHLHYSGQRDLLKVFERLAENNTLLYTTHLASMVDPAFPERVRIVESKDNHAVVKKGIISTQRAPMAVIEMCLGLTGDLSGLLGNRQVLIVEGGDDAIILNKLSALLRESNKVFLSDRIYLWPALGASKTPMYAGFAIGQQWDAGVLLDSDKAGRQAKEKINELYIGDLAQSSDLSFRTFLIGDAAKIEKTDAAIEDLFPDSFYLDCTNAAYGVAIDEEMLPADGSDMVTKRVEHVLETKHGRDLDKNLVMKEILRRFDGWSTSRDLPAGTVGRAEKLFRSINRAFK